MEIREKIHCGKWYLPGAPVLGAGSVVTHDLPDNAPATGVPCRVVREL